MHGFPHYLISALFLSAAATIAAPPAVVFDLNGQSTETGTLMRVNGHGSVNDGQPGVPLCGGFDCGGDGFKDVAMAHIQNDPLGRTGAGSVTLVFGDGAVGGTYDTSSFSSRVLKIAGDQSREIAGAEIWMDDVSGDGLGDLLIGRQNYMPATGREGAGALTIIFGSDLLRSNAARLAYFDLRSPPPAQCPGGHRGRQRWHLGWNAAHRLG